MHSSDSTSQSLRDVSTGASTDASTDATVTQPHTPTQVTVSKKNDAIDALGPWQAGAAVSDQGPCDHAKVRRQCRLVGGPSAAPLTHNATARLLSGMQALKLRGVVVWDLSANWSTHTCARKPKSAP